MIIEILNAPTDISHFPTEIQLALENWTKVDRNDLDALTEVSDSLIELANTIDEANDYETDYVTELEDLCCF